MKKGNLWLALSTTLSIFAALTAGISTLAWFQIDKQDPEAEMVTGSDNMEIQQNNVAGYKIVPQLGEDGFISVGGNPEKRTGDNIEISNVDKEGQDTNYDLPDDGVGFYLLKKMDDGNFKYTSGYYYKFDTYKQWVDEEGYNDNTNTVYLESVTLSAGATYRIRQYDFVAGKTVHQQIKVTSITGSGATINSDGDMDVISNTKYRIWLDYSTATSGTGRVGLEPYTLTTEGASVRVLSSGSNQNNNVERKARRNGMAGSVTNPIIVGTINGWDKSSTAYQLTGSGPWKRSNVHLTTTDSFKLVNLNSWDNVVGSCTYNSTYINFGDSSPGNDVNINCGKEGYFDFSITSAKALTITPSNYYPIIVGSFQTTEWDNTDETYKLTNSAGTWKKTNVYLPDGTNLKVINKGTWQSCATSCSATSPAAVTFQNSTFNNGENNIIITHAGYYDFTLTSGHALTISYNEADGHVVLCTSSSSTINDTASSTNYDVSSTQFPFTWDSSESQYVFKGYFASGATFKVVRQNTDSYWTDGGYGWAKVQTDYSSAYTPSEKRIIGESSGNITFTAAGAVTIYFKPYDGNKLYINYSVLSVMLNKNGGDTQGTSSIFEKYNHNFYTTTDCTATISQITKPTKANNKFCGYYTSNDSGSTFGTQYIDADGNITATSTTLKYDTTLYAKWLPSYTVTFNSHGGSAVSSQNVESGGKVTEPSPAPTRTGYTLEGWYQDYNDGEYSNKWNFSTGTVTGAMTLHAKWDYGIYKITLNNGGVTPDSAGTSAIYEKYTQGYYSNSGGTSSISSITTPSKANYVFNGYYTATNGGGTQYIDASGNFVNNASYNAFSSATTLYASWSYITYLYDQSGTSASPTWSSVQVYVWGSDTTNINPTTTTTHTDNAGTHNVYKFVIPYKYTSLLFHRTTNYTGGNGTQTIDLSRSDAIGKYYVMNGIQSGGTGNGNRNGTWYSAITSTTTYDYYYYDHSGTISSPYANIWYSGAVGTPTNMYQGWYLSSSDNAPGVAMIPYSNFTAAQKTAFTTAHGSRMNTAYVWGVFGVSETYDNLIIRTADNSSATVTLTPSSSNAGKFFVATGGSGSSRTGSWYSEVYTITYKAKYYTLSSTGTNTVTSISEYTLGKDYAFQSTTKTLPTGGYYDARYVVDSTEAILYKFARDDSGNGTHIWYKTNACDTINNNTYGASFTFTQCKDVYAKFTADIRPNVSTTHKTFYVNTIYSFHDEDHKEDSNYYWSSAKVHVSIGESAENEIYYNITGKQINATLYRFTVPIPADSSYNYIQLFNGSITYGAGQGSFDYADNLYYSTINSLGSGNSIIHIYNINSSATNVNHTVGIFKPVTQASYGTAEVQYLDGTWKKLVDMVQGDGKVNDFIYEHGVSIASGTQLRVKRVSAGVSPVTTYYGFDEYFLALPYYLDKGTTAYDSTKYGVMTNSAMRFNFYITSSGYLSIATVPNLGNGYYIMNYNEESSWSTATRSYEMTWDDTGLDASTYSKQYKGIVTYYAGDKFTVRTNNYLDVDFENRGAIYDEKIIVVSGDSTTAGGNDYVYVKESGTYDIYFKIKKAGGYDIYIGVHSDDTSLASASAVSSFTSGHYYLVGNTDVSQAVSIGKNVGFVGGKKMEMTSATYANYNGYYSLGSQSIYIRSYLNAVDTLYNSGISKGSGSPKTGCIVLCGTVGQSTDVQLDTYSGVITFNTNAKGYYNIYVRNGFITIEKYASSDFFRLNALDDSNLSSQDDVFNQKTCLIIEVPFTANNSYDSKVTLRMEGCPSYVGVYLYCRSSAYVSATQVYQNLHDGTANNKNYHYLSAYVSGSNVPDRANLTITKNNADHVYYAYIVLDYLYNGSFPTPFVASDSAIQFYLTVTQA